MMKRWRKTRIRKFIWQRFAKCCPSFVYETFLGCFSCISTEICSQFLTEIFRWLHLEFILEFIKFCFPSGIPEAYMPVFFWICEEFLLRFASRVSSGISENCSWDFYQSYSQDFCRGFPRVVLLPKFILICLKKLFYWFSVLAFPQSRGVFASFFLQIFFQMVFRDASWDSSRAWS